MADTCFAARTTTREHDRASIAKLTLLTTTGGQYKHENATTFMVGVRCILCKTYNPGDPGNGMDKLCLASNAITKIKSTTVITTKTVLDESKHSAATTTAASTS